MFRPACWMRLALIGGLLVGGWPGGTHAADKAQIQRAIDRAKDYLLKSPKTGAAGNLACYSLLKAGVDKQHPDVQKAVQDVLSRCQTNGYLGGTHHNYEAGVDAMLLEAVDREAYRPQLELIARYLVARQRPHGAWYYPTENAGSGDFGDTSITQYAILGLWAAARAGVEVPTETWERAAKWLLMTQRREGGFTYHPMEPSAQNFAGDATGTMTVAGTGSLLVIRHVLFNDVVFSDEVRPAASGRRFGVLERPGEEKQAKSTKPIVTTKPTMSVAAFDTALKAGVRLIGDRFADANSLTGYANYYYYGIERMAALLDVEKIGIHDWYNEGADDLLRRQAADGSWTDSGGPSAATALTLLFLTKATAGTINKPKRTPLVGGGLLVGGRGLPDNLDAVKIKEGAVNTRKLHGPVDGLLAELEKSSGAKVEAAQEAIVEAVQLEHPEDLIGQVDRLKRLAADKRIEVRRTAMWALGRTGNISVAPFLIRGLSDTDEAVSREASAALCILSRRPNGCGLPTEPLDGLADEATNEQRSAHLGKWQRASTKLWTDWYLKIRPYDERDDRATLKRKP